MNKMGIKLCIKKNEPSGINFFEHHDYSKAVATRCFVKQVFLKISQTWQKNTCVRVFLKIKLRALGLLVGIFVFVFSEHKPSVASRRLLSHLKYKFFVLKNDKKGYSSYLGQPISLCANLHRNNHRITSMLHCRLCN